MRIKEGYMLRETGDSRMVVACEPNAGSFRGMIRLNQSAGGCGGFPGSAGRYGPADGLNAFSRREEAAGRLL